MGCAYCTSLSAHHGAASKGCPESTLKPRAKPIPCGGAPGDSSDVVQPHHPRCAPAVLGARQTVALPALDQGGGSRHASGGKLRPQLGDPNTAPVPHLRYRNTCSMKAKAGVQWAGLSPAIFCCPHHAGGFICSSARVGG